MGSTVDLDKSAGLQGKELELTNQCKKRIVER